MNSTHRTRARGGLTAAFAAVTVLALGGFALVSPAAYADEQISSEGPGFSSRSLTNNGGTQLMGSPVLSAAAQPASTVYHSDGTNTGVGTIAFCLEVDAGYESMIVPGISVDCESDPNASWIDGTNGISIPMPNDIDYGQTPEGTIDEMWLKGPSEHTNGSDVTYWTPLFHPVYRATITNEGPATTTAYALGVDDDVKISGSTLPAGQQEVTFWETGWPADTRIVHTYSSAPPRPGVNGYEDWYWELQNLSTRQDAWITLCWTEIDEAASEECRTRTPMSAGGSAYDSGNTHIDIPGYPQTEWIPVAPSLDLEVACDEEATLIMPDDPWYGYYLVTRETDRYIVTAGLTSDSYFIPEGVTSYWELEIPEIVACPEPSSTPTPTPTPEPTVEPTPTPTPEPTVEPTPTPTVTPTPEPTVEPTPTPTPEPTVEPTPEPTEEPTPTPTPEPTVEPTPTTTPEPTEEPTPTPEPTEEPTPTPTLEPTPEPTEGPTPTPTPEPTLTPTPEPTEEPTPTPTETPVTPEPTPEETMTPPPTSTPTQTPAMVTETPEHLAATGGDIAPWLIGSAAVIAVTGVTLLLVARRRSSDGVKH